MIDGKLLRNDAITFKLQEVFSSKSDSVNFLSAGLGAKLAAGDKEGACLGYEHPAILTPDHLRRHSFAFCRARAANRPRRGKKSPDKAKREVRQNTIENEPEKHLL